MAEQRPRRASHLKRRLSEGELNSASAASASSWKRPTLPTELSNTTGSSPTHKSAEKAGTDAPSSSESHPRSSSLTKSDDHHKSSSSSSSTKKKHTISSSATMESSPSLEALDIPKAKPLAKKKKPKTSTGDAPSKRKTHIGAPGSTSSDDDGGDSSGDERSKSPPKRAKSFKSPSAKRVKQKVFQENLEVGTKSAPSDTAASSQSLDTSSELSTEKDKYSGKDSGKDSPKPKSRDHDKDKDSSKESKGEPKSPPEPHEHRKAEPRLIKKKSAPVVSTITAGEGLGSPKRSAAKKVASPVNKRLADIRQETNQLIVKRGGDVANPPLSKASPTEGRRLKYRARSMSTILSVADAKLFKKAWALIDEYEEHRTNHFDDLLQERVHEKLGMLTKRTSRMSVFESARTTQNLQISHEYKGPHLPNPLTPDSVWEMVEHFKERRTLHYKYANQIIQSELAYLSKSSRPMTEISLTDKARVNVIGDIHGQLADLLTLLRLQGRPSETNLYLFNGDFVDRGTFGPEVLLTLYALRQAYPGIVYLTRGNHEHRTLNKRYKFESQIIQKYDAKLYEFISQSFSLLPLCCLIANRVFVVHGGLCEFSDLTLAEVKEIPLKECPKTPKSREDKIIKQLLWSDPTNNAEDEKKSKAIKATGWKESTRGAGIVFGSAITKKFLDTNKLSLIVRSHQCVTKGYKYHHDKKLITIFSASRYCGKNDNKGAVVVVKASHPSQPELVQWDTADFFEKLTAVQDLPPIDRIVSDTLKKIGEICFKWRYALLRAFSQSEDQSLHSTDAGATATTPEPPLSASGAPLAPTSPPISTFVMTAPKQRSNALPSCMISLDKWRSTLKKVTGLKLAWIKLWPHLHYPDFRITGTLEPTTPINYRKFLDKFGVLLNSESLASWKKKTRETVRAVGTRIHSSEGAKAKFFDLLLKSSQLLPSASMMISISLNPSNEIRYVSYFKLVEALSSLPVKITQDEMYEFACYFDIESKGVIHLNDLRAFFKKMEIADAESILQRLALALSLSDKANKMRLESLFKTFDKTGKGINRFEYEQVLFDMGADTVFATPEERDRLFNLIDINKDEHISWAEFMEAFKFLKVDKNLAATRLLSLISQYYDELAQIFRGMSEDGSGVIEAEEFKSVLSTLLEIKQIDGVTDADIHHLFVSLAGEVTSIHYKDLFSRVRVVAAQ